MEKSLVFLEALHLQFPCGALFGFFFWFFHCFIFHFIFIFIFFLFLMNQSAKRGDGETVQFRIRLSCGFHDLQYSINCI